MIQFYNDFGFQEIFPQYRLELFFTKILKKRGARGRFQHFVNLLIHIAIFLFPKYKEDPDFCLSFFIEQLICPKVKQQPTTSKIPLLTMQPFRLLEGNTLGGNSEILMVFVRNDNLLKHVFNTSSFKPSHRYSACLPREMLEFIIRPLSQANFC